MCVCLCKSIAVPCSTSYSVSQVICAWVSLDGEVGLCATTEVFSVCRACLSFVVAAFALPPLCILQRLNRELETIQDQNVDMHMSHSSKGKTSSYGFLALLFHPSQHFAMSGLCTVWYVRCSTFLCSMSLIALESKRQTSVFWSYLPESRICQPFMACHALVRLLFSPSNVYGVWYSLLLRILTHRWIVNLFNAVSDFDLSSLLLWKTLSAISRHCSVQEYLSRGACTASCTCVYM